MTHEPPERPWYEEIDAEWYDWYCLTPAERWRETTKLWEYYLAVGGSLDPEPDPQIPFYNAYVPSAFSSHARNDERVIRRSEI